jgi:hypothetical protein
MISSLLDYIANCCSPYENDEDRLEELTEYFADLTKVTIVGESGVGKTGTHVFFSVISRRNTIS